jgi:hypothetical protein
MSQLYSKIIAFDIGIKKNSYLEKLDWGSSFQNEEDERIAKLIESIPVTDVVKPPHVLEFEQAVNIHNENSDIKIFF